MLELSNSHTCYDIKQIKHCIALDVTVCHSVNCNPAMHITIYIAVTHLCSNITLHSTVILQVIAHYIMTIRTLPIKQEPHVTVIGNIPASEPLQQHSFTCNNFTLKGTILTTGSFVTTKGMCVPVNHQTPTPPPRVSQILRASFCGSWSD